MVEPLLRFRNVSKRFGGTLAVNRVNLEVEAGSVLALLGENGAGKSTLIKLLAGIYPLDEGEILFKGAALERSKTSIAYIHQDLGLTEWMTVAENIAMSTGYPRRFGLIDWAASRRQAERVLELVGGDIDPNSRVHSLSRTEKSLVAIARALAVEAELLILDEPTASLPESDVARLFGVLEGLRERGIGMIYISHRLDEVFRLSDRVAVMRDGALIGVREVSQTNTQELVKMIVGKAPPRTVRTTSALGKTVLELSQVSISQSGGAVGPVSFTLKAGEMVGLAGLRGAGQEAVGRALFGLESYTGEVKLNAKTLRVNSPQEAVTAGVSFVSRNRQEESLCMTLSVCENFYLNPELFGRAALNLKTRREEGREALELAQRYDVQPPEPEFDMNALSGGNQQKVVVGRWLEVAHPLLILEEPTQGVDVGAKTEIYALLAEALARGVAILVISTDVEEIAKICGRALVFVRGQLSAELTGEGLSMESLITHSSGTRTHAATSPTGTIQRTQL